MKTPVPRFDLGRAREVAGIGSRRFWASLEELLDEESFRALLRAEFPQASSMFDDPGRRQFLKLMGASLLLGGLSACGDTKSDQGLPYVNQPESVVPGVARHYATGIDDDNVNLAPACIPTQGAGHQQIKVGLNAGITRHSQNFATLGGNFGCKLVQPLFASR